MRKIKQRFPRRRELLAAPFSPLSDEAFRTLAAKGTVQPCQQGSALFVTKWRDGAGMDPGAFLVALHEQGSTLEVREFGSDFNVRVVRASRPADRASPTRASLVTGSSHSP